MSSINYRISNIIGHEMPVKFLNGLFLNDRLPAGLIFYGQKNIGKRFTALSFAASILCRDYLFYNREGDLTEEKEDADDLLSLPLLEGSGPCELFEDNEKLAACGSKEPSGLDAFFCGKCPSCLGVLNGTNQNLIIVEPEGNSIKIDKINQVNSLLSLTSNFKGHRFVIIDDAYSMNSSAMSALLKILEEPPDKTMFILILSNINSVLQTIVSRCSLLSFMPVSDELLFSAFKAKFPDTPDDVLSVYLKLANGSYSKLARLMGGNYFEIRKSVLGLILNESFYRNTELFKYEIADEFNKILKNYRGKDNEKDKENNDKIELFELFLFILRDIYIYYMTRNAKLLYNIDVCADIDKFIINSGIKPQRLLNMIDSTLGFIDKMGYNLNKTIAIDAYFSDILTNARIR